MANAEHLDLLVNKGVEAWNEWRGNDTVTLHSNPDGTFDAEDIPKLLYLKHEDWVLDPIRYPSVEDLVDVLDTEIIQPAEKRFSELLVKKAKELHIRDIPARDNRSSPSPSR
jgi:hypothetical protein